MEHYVEREHVAVSSTSSAAACKTPNVTSPEAADAVAESGPEAHAEVVVVTPADAPGKAAAGSPGADVADKAAGPMDESFTLRQAMHTTAFWIFCESRPCLGIAVSARSDFVMRRSPLGWVATLRCQASTRSLTGLSARAQTFIGSISSRKTRWRTTCRCSTSPPLYARVQHAHTLTPAQRVCARMHLRTRTRAQRAAASQAHHNGLQHSVCTLH